VRGGIAIALLALAGCGAGTGEGLDQNGQPISSGVGATPLAPTLASIQVNVFSAYCEVCHRGAAAPQGLQLEPGLSGGNLINVHSPQDPTLMLIRVIPGNPDASFLIQKLEGTQTLGDRMPLGGPPYLPQSTIDVVRQWIQDGALQ